MTNNPSQITNKRVALVLGSGGARGLAHIGAIEALEERGYTITSISGCSMGSIIAGMYAAGQIKQAKEWFLQVDKQIILRMMDINLLSRNSLVKGEKIIRELQTIVPDQPIESLRIPCALVATDMLHTEQVVFRSGSLFDAIRASISIPLFFKPVELADHLLIDGGILNPLPLDVVERHEGDLLVAMDISGKDSLPVTRKVNFISMLDRMSDMQIQQNTMLSLRLNPPDIYAVMKQYAYNTFDFDKAEEIIADGKRIMNEALDAHEKRKE